MTATVNPEKREVCPNCRTNSVHKLIAVSDSATIAWCENCRVPRLAEPQAGAAAPSRRNRADNALPSRAASGKWRWFDVA